MYYIVVICSVMEKLKAMNDGQRNIMWLVNNIISFFLTILLMVKTPVTKVHDLEILWLFQIPSGALS